MSPINYHLLAAQQELYKKACILTKTIEETLGEGGGVKNNNWPIAENGQDGKVNGARKKHKR